MNEQYALRKKLTMMNAIQKRSTKQLNLTADHWPGHDFLNI